MLRMWADNIERFAGNYQTGLEETATTVEEQLGSQRARVINADRSAEPELVQVTGSRAVAAMASSLAASPEG